MYWTYDILSRSTAYARSMETRPAPAATHVVVRTPMNRHGTVTVEVAETNETRHLVEYASSDVRQTLASLPAGSRIPLTLVRAGARSNVWRVEDIHGDRPAPRADSGRRARRVN
jgi:hypothetical protein